MFDSIIYCTFCSVECFETENKSWNYISCMAAFCFEKIGAASQKLLKQFNTDSECSALWRELEGSCRLPKIFRIKLRKPKETTPRWLKVKSSRQKKPRIFHLETVIPKLSLTKKYRPRKLPWKGGTPTKRFLWRTTLDLEKSSQVETTHTKDGDENESIKQSWQKSPFCFGYTKSAWKWAWIKLRPC